MRLALPVILLLTSALPAISDLPAPQGHVLITLGGNVSETNLPARAEDDGGLLGFLGVSHDGAAGYDAAMLDSLPQIEITIPYGTEDNLRDITFSGPLLSDIMIMVGAEGKTAIPMAMDGYRAEISWQNISAYRPILATHADGAPMGIGGYGPTMIVFPPTENEDIADEQAGQQVWALAYISVE